MRQMNPDVSLSYFDIMRDPQSDRVERENAFAKMMALNGGWWGHRKLYDFAVACAFGCTRYKLAPYGIAVDRIDFESLANEGLMLLFHHAAEIRGESPRLWLAGTIKNLVKSEIRRNWQYLTTGEMPEDLLPGEDQITEGERTILALSDKVLDAIRRLTPALRVVAELYYVHRVPRHELAVFIEVSEETLRKRLQRAREALQRELGPKEQNQPKHESVNS